MHRRKIEKKVRLTAVAVAVVLLAACTPEEEKSDVAGTAVEFAVDETLLGEWARLPHLGVRLRLPAGWSAAELPETGQEGTAFELRAFYAGPGPSYLIAGDLPGFDLAGAVAEAEDSAAEASGEDEPPGVRRFSHAGIDFLHTVGGGEETLSHSFIFEGPQGEPVMLRYIVPREDVAYRSELIESSFGTVESWDPE